MVVQAAVLRPGRLASIDAYRGMVMLLLQAEALRLCAVSAVRPGSRLWAFLCHHQSHVEWVGCSVHDLIMPGFCFLVGVAMPFSIAGRSGQVQDSSDWAKHVLRRILFLMLIGTLIAWAHGLRLVWPFDWVLPQIALGYGFLFLLAFRPSREIWIAICIILVGYWLLFALFPLPSPAFDFSAVGVSTDWLQAHGLQGFEAHWQKNSNAAWAFDRWLYNALPGGGEFTHFDSGLATLNFIPTLATMLLGLLAGRTLRDRATPWGKARQLTVVGIAILTIGLVIGWSGVCPIVKRIWTPSWVLFSGGLCFLFLALSYVVVDILRFRWLAFPLVVIGVNSIVAYCLAELYPALAFNSLKRVVGDWPFQVFGAAYEPLVYGATIVLAYWTVLFVMYRRGMFLRV